MSTSDIRGVVPAVPTPVSDLGEPDTLRLIAFCQHLLREGADALNITGTTGEATSLSREQRQAIISALEKCEIDKSRLMVGTGAAAVTDAVALSRSAAEAGFAGALVLPPFYFKDPSKSGLLRYFEAIVAATQEANLNIYLYNFPALSGVAFAAELVDSLVRAFGVRIKGLKDSSGDLKYASEIAARFPELKVFPSNEGTLLDARSGKFAGAISATANLSTAACVAAFRSGDERELEKAKTIRAIIAEGALVPRVKAVLSGQLNDAEWANVLPPYDRLSLEEARDLSGQIEAIVQLGSDYRQEVNEMASAALGRSAG